MDAHSELPLEPGAAPDLAQRAVLGVAFAVGFSPGAIQLTSQWAAAPWTRYSVLFPGLAAWAMWRERAGARPSRTGLGMIAVAIVLQVVALRAGLEGTARAALVLGAIGLVRALGLGTLQSATLLAFAAPLPASISALASPALERLWLGVAAALPGAGLSIDGSHALAQAGTLTLIHPDGGLPLSAMLAGLAWYGIVRQGIGRGRLRRVMGAAAVALPVQGLAVVSACGVLAAGAPQLARTALTYAPALLLAALAVVRIEQRCAAEAAT